MIRVLDDATIGQIAAGEVIERPASVVKELVENALDAGAQAVAVTIARGGLDLIEVRDDGTGIAAADMPLAPRRHATSKLRGADGLASVTTLGFRGEGLASIAAVASVRIVSRVPGSEVAYAVEAAGEGVSEPQPVAAPPGTRVEVRDLFANVPVRREFLRSQSVEFSRISSFLAMLSLGYPQVRFSLVHDGRDVWTFPAVASLEQRLSAVFGPAAAKELIALDEPASTGAVAVRGYVSKPAHDRPDRRMQLLFVNGRLLRTTLLAGAWSSAYSTFTMSGRQPYGVLFVTVPAVRVDPNVHPTKSDVRLRDAGPVTEAVKRAIAAALGRHARERFESALAAGPAQPYAPAVSFAPAAPAKPPFSYAAICSSRTSQPTCCSPFYRR